MVHDYAVLFSENKKKKKKKKQLEETSVENLKEKVELKFFC